MFYTIGHSNLSIEEFIEQLKKFGIEVVVDVRRFPTSKHEHFKRENLEEFLKREGIDYVWLGKYLGGYRGDYAKYMESEDFKRGIKELLKLRDKKVAIMCAERFYMRCHRKYISEYLEALGFEVYHIQRGKAYRHKKLKGSPEHEN